MARSLEGTDLKSDAGAILRAETTSLDSLGRVSTIVSDALGTTTYGYTGTQRRPATVTGPNFVSSYTYYADNDPQKGRARQLASITHQVGGATIAGHTYGYDAAGRINSWEQVRSGLPTATWKYGYNGADELIAARRTDATGAVLDDEHWTYDPAGNWLSHTVGAAMQTRSHNNLNQITSLGGPGTTTVEGTINELATVNVTVTNASGSVTQPASVSVDPAGGYRFRRDVPVVVGSNTVNAVATDQQNEQSSASRTFNVAAAGASFIYDANGNTKNDGQRTFTWDGKNRLKTVTVGSDTYSWDYDHHDRRCIERRNGIPQRRWVWEGLRIVQERGADNAVLRDFYTIGEAWPAQAGASEGKRLYARDHLRSTRELVDAAGGIRARYDYSPYGNVARTSGDLEAEFRFTGHQYHTPTGLHLAPYRAYDSALGRWLSRDPFGSEASQMNAAASQTDAAAFYADGIFVAELLPEGPNLYGYVANDPLGDSDPSGEAAPVVAVGVAIVGGVIIRTGIRYFTKKACPRAAAKGLDVLCKNRATAKNVAKQAGKGRRPKGPENHGPAPDYRPHYHNYDRTSGHVFY